MTLDDSSQNPHQELVTLDDLRAMARALLTNDALREQLSTEFVEALVGLLVNQPTGEQLQRGVDALTAINQALAPAYNQINLAKKIDGWIRAAPDWDASRAYLKDHADALLTDEAEHLLVELHGLQKSDGARQRVAEHQQLLRDTRTHGIDDAYNAFLAQRRSTGSGSSDTGVAEMGALLAELQGLISRNGDPRRQEELCRRILQLEEQAHVHDPQLRGMILGTRGIALQQIAESVGGQEHLDLLHTTLACFDNALLELHRDTAPLDWATTQINKGNALNGLAHGQSGTEGATTLRAAIACFDNALLEIRRDNDPLGWATSQYNKGNALRDLAGRQGGVERAATLRAAIACFDNTLLEYHQEITPLKWASIQSSKGTALRSLARGQWGAERAITLHDAITCFDNALLEQRQDTDPREWTLTQTEKGTALRNLAEGQTGVERAATLRAAIACFDNALLEWRQDTAPLDWAGTQDSIGATLMNLADGQVGAERATTLRAAIACFNNALLEKRRDNDPLGWAGTQNNKGATLAQLAGGQGNTEPAITLRAAIACFDQALLEWQQDTAPLNWASVQDNKGSVLANLAKRQSGAERATTLHAVESAYCNALSEYPLELHPSDYRRSAHALARAYLLSAAGIANPAEEQDSLEQAWQVASSAAAAADLLELRAPSLSFRQQEWSENASLFNLAGCIAARRGRLGEAVALFERGRARGLAEAAGRRSADLEMLTPADRAEYSLAVEVVQRIEAQGRQGGDALTLVNEARAANEQLAAMVTRLRKAYPGFLPEQHVSIPALAAALQPGEALIYLIPQETGTLLLVIPHDGGLRMKWLANLTSDDIFTLAVQSDERGYNRGGFLPAALGWLHNDPLALVRTLDDLLPQMGEKLMQTVVKLARYAGCQRIVLVPSGFLSVLPLHAASYLPLAGEPATAPGGRRYACDDLSITYAPSALVYLDARQTAIRQRRAGKAQRIFTAGNPQLTRKSQPWTPKDSGYLRYAEWEASRVAEIASQRTPPLAADLALNEQATWTRVVRGLDAADVAHLALHAAFNFSDPQQSAFLVAFQAKLLLRNLLDPQQVNLARLRLVILSACQSAIGDVNNQSEEAVGLFGALLAGGVPGVIGTLWSVNDLATAALMESFARRYLVEGQPPDAALRGAARELRGMRDAPERASNPASQAAPGATGQDDQHTAEEITTVEVEVLPPAAQPLQQPQATPALQRWQELANRDPEAVGATRNLSPEDLAGAGQDVAAFRAVPRNHPVYWAAFVFHGAALPLDDGSDTSYDGAAATRRTAPPEVTMSDDQNTQNTASDTTGQHDGNDIPTAESRMPSYFAAAEEVCPRCHAQDYIPVRDAQGRDLRHCASCGLDYLPRQSADGSDQ